MTEVANAAATSSEAGQWVTSRVGRTGFFTEVDTRNHALIADEPIESRGTDRGPTPYEFLLTAIGSCTAMTLRFYADRKGWPLESASVSLRSGRSHEADCENCADEKVGIAHIDRRIALEGNLTDEQRQRLLEIADRCPVKQTLERGIHIQNAAT